MNRKTDWDSYYDRPVTTSRYSRPITERRLVNTIRAHADNAGQNLRFCELGGANSCFFDRLKTEFRPREYHIVDNNARGLDLFRPRAAADPSIHLHLQDALNLDLQLQADVVFSVGLIEHFLVDGTRQVVDSHFRLLKPGGLLVITFPTPTWLYRACRTSAELLRVWRFHDERPLLLPEVRAAVTPHADLLHHEIVWPIVLTQMIIVARKHPAAPPLAAHPAPPQSALA